MAINVNVVVDASSVTIGTWGVTSATNANPSVSFAPVQAKAFTQVFVTNTVTPNMGTVSVTSFTGSAVGVTLTNGSARISVTPNSYANIMDGGMPGPLTTFVPSVKDIALGVPTLLISGVS